MLKLFLLWISCFQVARAFKARANSISIWGFPYIGGFFSGSFSHQYFKCSFGALFLEIPMCLPLKTPLHQRTQAGDRRQEDAGSRSGGCHRRSRLTSEYDQPRHSQRHHVSGLLFGQPFYPQASKDSLANIFF